MSHADELGLGPFSLPPDDGLSLEELSRAYAELVRGAQEPYEDGLQEESDAQPVGVDDSLAQADAACPLTPRSILEAILFVGHPQNEPLQSRQIAQLMRGVRPQEIDELIRDLNQQYAAERCPYEIRAVGAGYRMELRPEFAPLREKLRGWQKAARLSQPAIDVLAIVAYQQPVTREQVEQWRGKPSGAILNQLVRRQLLRVERSTSQGRRVTYYYTTTRFLELLGLNSLEELPRSEDLEDFSD